MPNAEGRQNWSSCMQTGNGQVSRKEKKMDASTSKYFANLAEDRDSDRHLFSLYGFSMYQSQIACLDDENFVNDLVIDFYLEHLQRQLSPEIRRKIHVFNTFFWKKLQAEPSETPIKMHEKVKRWTKGVDLFEKDYVLVPINEHCHWYLAIICFPGLEKAMYEVSMDHRRVQASKRMKAESGSDDPTAHVDNGRRLIREPRIIILDSLKSIYPKYSTTAVLRDYLTAEWKTRKGHLGSRRFVGGREWYHASDKSNMVCMKGFYPTPPQQENFSDCGIFLLEYAERFLTSGWPHWKMTANGVDFGDQKESPDVHNWFPAHCGTEKRAELRNLMNQLAEECQRKDFEIVFVKGR